MKSLRDHYHASTTNTPEENADALLNAIVGGAFEVPDETYECASVVMTEPRINMFGCGSESKIKIPELRIECPVANHGSHIRDVAFLPVELDVGAGLVIKQTHDDGAFFDFNLAGLNIGCYAGAGLTFDNSIASVDAFFTGIVDHCQIANQVKGINIGDRITFRDLKVYGGSLVAMEMSFVSGARNTSIENGTFVTRGGAISIMSGAEILIMNNHIEHPAYLGNYTGSLQTQVSLFNSFACRVVYNRINASHGSAGPSGAVTGSNYDVVIQGANSAHNTVMDNTLGPSAQPVRAVISGAGAGNSVDIRNVYN